MKLSEFESVFKEIERQHPLSSEKDFLKRLSAMADPSKPLAIEEIAILLHRDATQYARDLIHDLLQKFLVDEQ